MARKMKAAADEDDKALQHAATLAAPLHQKRGFSSLPTELHVEAGSIHLGDLNRLQTGVDIIIKVTGKQGWRIVSIDKRTSLLEKVMLTCSLGLVWNIVFTIGIVLVMLVRSCA